MELDSGNVYPFPASVGEWGGFGQKTWSISEPTGKPRSLCYQMEWVYQSFLAGCY